MTQLKLTSPIPPSVNHYLGYRGVMKNGRPMAMSYCTSEAKNYKSDFAKYVTEEVKKQGWVFPSGERRHFYVDAIFYFPATHLDCNNYWKCLLDAITDTQLVWPDDDVVCERVQGIYYDSENPRIELVIHPVEYIGIFNNETALQNFESRCETCARYARNCSILQRAKFGRIQDDIADGVCAKYNKKKE